MKDQVQQVVVRVVASELDRRARPLEQAIRDLQQRATNIEAGGVTLPMHWCPFNTASHR
jgi:hypothetical protein